MKLFTITEPKVAKVPIIISSPHSGTYFPEMIADKFRPEMIEKPDDTDWFIDKLYDFAPDLGITMITANYSRWVIDLNRDPDSKPLYDDGRVITGLTPTTNFNGEALYQGEALDSGDIDLRIENYYRPYHDKIMELLDQTKQQFGKALLFDAHSIRKVVPGIQKEPFPDLILGDNDGATASEALINSALNVLKTSGKTVEHNHPFKGGYITRSFGKPSENIHALQLEMAKTNYMDDSETKYHYERAEVTRENLKEIFKELINVLK
ncbi:N-formylglutamate amidohydrolase [Flagellimonas okinawensis]|uniref:N-formylglutamate amidohydrolase n=1 Tax=Flagellimonas okinawensis TaxID=3031324 RepID=A0ABT5XM73_9FLAO|nr:N-formylglutamate amidohydrolase [[Muricauda] okinawensis]MDF0706987.1 N-formylglutamate amidohydrolase [[Muricauda] okinawensis]